MAEQKKLTPWDILKMYREQPKDERANEHIECIRRMIVEHPEDFAELLVCGLINTNNTIHAMQRGTVQGMFAALGNDEETKH